MNAPRHVIALLLPVLSATAFGACDKLTSNTIAGVVQDDARNDRSWSGTWTDQAGFRCLASTGGRCNIVVFVSVCAGASCNTRLAEELAVMAGASQKLTALPRSFKHCVAHDAKPVAPACLKA